MTLLPLPLRRPAARLAGAAAMLLLFAAPALVAQRLPTNVRPEHYTLHLTPDLDKATFSGEETIDVTLAQPADSITLNALELQFQSVTASRGTASGGKHELKADVSLDTAKQQATFAFPGTLPAGPVKLKIAYTGILNDKLRGFYLSKAGGRRYAVTQFESTDARRAFPSFDEPDFKATFDVTIVAPKDDMVISNTNVISDTAGPAVGEHTVEFARTPKMSTYLMAFLIGDFKCMEGSSDGVPIRACATPERLEYTHLALTAAEYILHYYDTYFGIKYPMPKLDMIGIPDFEAGAMENFGAITYRESDMLVDEKNAPVRAKAEVASVVAHEMAHQWFGDMVTMKWWDNIWLNEGFATWMSNKPLEAWKPEWHIDEQVASDMNGAMNLDAQKVTRTIRAEANTPDEINEMFDGITYEKGSSILHMVESYLGEETFRQGVHNYLQTHMYGNATAEDFWNAQTANSHKPVDKIMESFITEPGVPLLTFGKVANGQVEVTQSRFFLNPKTAPEQAGDQVWTVPVCFKTEGTKRDCELLTSQHGTLKVPEAALFYADGGAAGYYRSAYTPADYEALLSRVTSLTAPERINVVDDELALMRAGKSKAGDFLSLAASLKNDDSAAVTQNVVAGVNTLWARVAATDADRKELSAWVVSTYAPRLTNLGEPQESDTPERQELRAELFGLVGGIGQDPKVIAESKQLTQAFLADPGKGNATLARAAAEVAATNGDAAIFDLLQKTAETSKDPGIANGALHDLARFKDPELTRRALEYATSGKVRNQDSISLFSMALRNPDTQDTAWKYIEDNWARVKAQFTMFTGGSLVGSTGAFCTAERRDQVKDFFTTHKVAASANALTRSQNSINDCVDLRAEQSGNLQQWLSSSAVGQM
ncbi:MAG TPA: M1 family aminopeptidase [Acidobacteriaceae bacterium]|nr:M1 family aminopeptidase [Acidobacteriaceae bacterium]